MGKLFGFGALLAFAVAAGVFRAFVLTRLWTWFVVPLGVPAIGLAHAIGLCLILGLFLYGLAREKDDKERDEWWEKSAVQTGSSCVASLVSWGIGAAIAGLVA